MIKEERLTNSYEMKQIEICNPNLIGIGKEYKRLYEYENTNLSPQEVEQLKQENEELKNENNEFCSYNKKIREENLKLKAELEELKKNSIVPKFKIKQTIWYLLNNTIYKAIVEHIKVHYTNKGKINIQYVVVSPDRFRNHKNEKDLFATPEQAEEALKKLEEK